MRAGRAERLFAKAVASNKVDELRATTGYNPRQRVATAHRLLTVVVIAFLYGQPLRFSSLRAFFVRRFGKIRPRAFQLRFKDSKAAAFFRAVLEHMVATVIASTGVVLTGPLAVFTDIRVYDGTGQRVPPRGRAALPGCTAEKAGAKCLIGYSLRSGLIEQASHDAETASELPMWRLLVPQMERGVLYLMDLAFFSREVFAEALAGGAHLLLRLKSNAKVTVMAHRQGRRMVDIPAWSLSTYLAHVSTKRGTTYDLDVRWGHGRSSLDLRVVGVSLGGRKGVRWYMTTVSRAVLTAEQIVECYRLRWSIELLIREIKQSADLGRSPTADPNALQALTYGAFIGHVVVRSVRLFAAIRHQVPLDQLRPLACLAFVRACADDLVAALFSGSRTAWEHLVVAVADQLVDFAREPTPSQSRPRIGPALGALGC